MGVSGEFKFFGPDFSSVARVRPVKAITLPASLAIGNITRLRNLEYMAARAASDFRLESKSPPCPSKERTDEDGAPAASGFWLSASGFRSGSRGAGAGSR